MGTSFSIKDALDKIDDEVDQESYSLWGGTGLSNQQDTDLFNSPKFQEIVYLLLQSPILVAPTLNWLRLKQGEIARAQLEALYTPEQLEEMYKEVQNETQK
jgi:hypothetical protein